MNVAPALQKSSVKNGAGTQFAALGPFDDPYQDLEPFANGVRHLYSASQFTDHKLLAAILDRADEIAKQIAAGIIVDTPLREHGKRPKLLHTLFVGSPSTRTIHSINRAADLLGMDVTVDTSLQGSSVEKGESWEHTVMALDAMLPDVFAIRANDQQLVWRAMQISSVPVINCGAGETGDHPTQMLGDAYLIKNKLGRLDNLRFVIIGDARNSRVIRSNLTLWSNYASNSFELYTPQHLSLAPDIRKMLDGSGCGYREYANRQGLHESLAKADVVYVMTDVKTAQSGTKKYKTVADLDDFVVDWQDADMMPQHALLMHPLPNAGEIRPRLDFHPRSVYASKPGTRRMDNEMTAGLIARMASLEWVFGLI